jgi:lantibiotic leader peptide-processing serine protease
MKKTAIALVLLAVLLVFPMGFQQHALAASKKLNPWNITLIKFHPGLSAAQMKTIVTAAGGTIVTDLTQLNAIAAVPLTKDFSTRVSANAKVKAVWVEKLNVTIPREDVVPADGSVTGKNQPPLGNPGAITPPDPWHNEASFWGETNPEGILQWDDNRMNVPAAWPTTTGDRTVRVAVLDTGVRGSHKEILPNYDNQTSANMIPCNTLVHLFGPLGRMDCSSEDTYGHGTWVASRIAGAANGFASNGIAPKVQVIGYKVLSTYLGGGLTSWIAAGMVDACSHNVNLINMSLGGYDDPNIDAGDYLLWVEAVNFCRSKGTAIFASAGNEHIRINRVDMTVGDVALTGVGQVDAGDQGIVTIIPGDTLANNDYRGLLETPAGVPGVIMVSATGNANGLLPANAGYSLSPYIQKPPVGARDQLAYYSNYGSRIDITAPGGARKLGLPRYDAGNADILYGGWGTLGALDASSQICTDPSLASPLTFACFKVTGAGFGWLQGTSMSSPNATGVAALTLAAHHELQGHPDGLLARLQSTARKDMVNMTGPNDVFNLATSLAGVPCATGYCHLTYGDKLISFVDAYGAGMVNAAGAVAP